MLPLEFVLVFLVIKLDESASRLLMITAHNRHNFVSILFLQICVGLWLFAILVFPKAETSQGPLGDLTNFFAFSNSSSFFSLFLFLVCLFVFVLFRKPCLSLGNWCQSLSLETWVASLCNDDNNGKKSVKNKHLRNCNKFAIIPSFSHFTRRTPQLAWSIQRSKYSRLYAQVVIKMVNVVIPRLLFCRGRTCS